MRFRFAVLLIALSACATKPVVSTPASSTPSLAYCPPAKFANCTVAKCELKPDGNYSCRCFEDDRYSATAWAGSQQSSCVAASGNSLQSRYYPTKAYQLCETGAPVQQWAWCLGVMCTRDPNATDPKDNVRCDCLAIPANVAPVPYIVTTDAYSPQNCAFRYWSSAIPSDVSQITSFLQKQPGLEHLQPPVLLNPR